MIEEGEEGDHGALFGRRRASAMPLVPNAGFHAISRLPFNVQSNISSYVQGAVLGNVVYLGWWNEVKTLSFNGKAARSGCSIFFVGEMTARTAADLAGVNKTTAAYFFHRLREIIA